MSGQDHIERRTLSPEPRRRNGDALGRDFGGDPFGNTEGVEGQFEKHDGRPPGGNTGIVQPTDFQLE